MENVRKRRKICAENTSRSGWKDLPEDILVMIFSRLDPEYYKNHNLLFSSAYVVCQTWRTVSRPLVFANTYYRNGYRHHLSFNLFKGCIDVNDAKHFMHCLDALLDALDQKGGCISSIKLPQNLHLSDHHLYYLAKRLPKLTCLQLPHIANTVTTAGFGRAIQCLNNLKFLEVGPTSDYSCVIREIGRNCKNLRYLGLIGSHAEDDPALVIDEHTSLTIAKYLDTVHTLSFTKGWLQKAGMKKIISSCKYLKNVIVYNCTHAMTSDKIGSKMYTLSRAANVDNYTSVSSALDALWYET